MLSHHLTSRLQSMPHPEQLLYDEGFMHVAGTDEAGRGPLAGPVVAAAVVLPAGWQHPGIRDSKKLSARARAELFPVITAAALSWNWAAVDARDIDRMNILQASLHAMRAAVQGLTPGADFLLVDGPHIVPGCVRQAPIKRGDQKSRLIAAASILAKVVRDAIMEKYDRLYPAYFFRCNKGYGTAQHMQALMQHGCCRVHRRSFKKVVSKGQTCYSF